MGGTCRTGHDRPRHFLPSDRCSKWLTNKYCARRHIDQPLGPLTTSHACATPMNPAATVIIPTMSYHGPWAPKRAPSTDTPSRRSLEQQGSHTWDRKSMRASRTRHLIVSVELASNRNFAYPRSAVRVPNGAVLGRCNTSREQTFGHSLNSQCAMRIELMSGETLA